MAKTQSPVTAEAVAFYMANPSYTQKLVASMFKINASNLSRAINKAKYPGQKPPKNARRSIAAVQFMLENPGSVIKKVADAHRIHRVTLCNALALLRKPCPTCGHPVRAVS
jgi:hypothetical protein